MTGDCVVHTLICVCVVLQYTCSEAAAGGCVHVCAVQYCGQSSVKRVGGRRLFVYIYMMQPDNAWCGLSTCRQLFVAQEWCVHIRGMRLVVLWFCGGLLPLKACAQQSGKGAPWHVQGVLD